MNSDAVFWNKIAAKYERKPVPDESIYQRKLEMTRLLLNPNAEVLELGCGTGSTALLHAPFVHSVVATDFSASMIEIARNKARQQGVDNIEFRCESVEDMAVGAGQFDVVLAHSILHLLQDPQQAISQCYQSLKPGGYLVSSTACIADFFKLFAFVFPIAYRLGLFPLREIFWSRYFD